jgi:hypothetical protein
MSPETSDNRGAHWLAVATRMRNRAELAEDRVHVLHCAMVRIAEGNLDSETATAVARDALAESAVKQAVPQAPELG